jgi:hypothetical protein
MYTIKPIRSRWRIDTDDLRNATQLADFLTEKGYEVDNLSINNELGQAVIFIEDKCDLADALSRCITEFYEKEEGEGEGEGKGEAFTI